MWIASLAFCLIITFGSAVFYFIAALKGPKKDK